MSEELKVSYSQEGYTRKVFREKHAPWLCLIDPLDTMAHRYRVRVEKVSHILLLALLSVYEILLLWNGYLAIETHL